IAPLSLMARTCVSVEPFGLKVVYVAPAIAAVPASDTTSASKNASAAPCAAQCDRLAFPSRMAFPLFQPGIRIPAGPYPTPTPAPVIAPGRQTADATSQIESLRAGEGEPRLHDVVL